MHMSAQPAHHASVAAASTKSFEQALAGATLKRVEAKEFVFAEGDAASHVYRVETGAVALFKVLIDGRRQIVGFAYPGDLVGLGAEGEHMMNAQAIKPTRLRCLPISGLHRSVAQDPTLYFQLYQAVARELASARDLMLTTGQRTAAERVVSFLLALSRRNGRTGRDPAMLELPMTRSDIGDFLGLTIETVSRTFTKLRAMGLIELVHSSEVKLIDIDALKSLADGEDRDQ
ncbi:MAG: helix-turn-helix domain-containing protein [Hyphomicrobiaceae bacterium]